VAVVVLVPLLYVLSLGPAVRLLNQEGVPPQVWNTYHGPAWLIASHSDAFDQAIQRYMGLWMPAPMLKPLASPYYQFEGVQYFPPGPEFPLSNEAAPSKAHKSESADFDYRFTQDAFSSSIPQQ
jgi:hypothetical protein